MFGIPDERCGEQLKAVVETRPRHSAEALQAFVPGAPADYKVPGSVELVDELPRHPNGKVMKRWLREQAWAGHDRGSASVSSPNIVVRPDPPGRG